ncbi:hypothetical protein Golax_001157 [Gossypium laxum]|uniref:Uncharacterized protein n=1 Tax=Gossypium laxum TaxID=34288 RepID=A0A7J9AXY5_9ROSI|nr:hypothetical protein [Gossypium laxum]
MDVSATQLHLENIRTVGFELSRSISSENRKCSKNIFGLM